MSTRDLYDVIQCVLEMHCFYNNVGECLHAKIIPTYLPLRFNATYTNRQCRAPRYSFPLRKIATTDSMLPFSIGVCEGWHSRWSPFDSMAPRKRRAKLGYYRTALSDAIRRDGETRFSINVQVGIEIVNPALYRNPRHLSLSCDFPISIWSWNS